MPDVCKTPDKGIPLPYQNEAYSRDLIKGTVSVFAEGAMGGNRHRFDRLGLIISEGARVVPARNALPIL